MRAIDHNIDLGFNAQYLSIPDVVKSLKKYFRSYQFEKGRRHKRWIEHDDDPKVLFKYSLSYCNLVFMATHKLQENILFYNNFAALLLYTLYARLYILIN